METAVEINPVAIFRTRKKNPYDAARQAHIDQSDEIGEIHFLAKQNFEQALDDIEGFSHLWLIYQFHHNPNWKPKVSPPRGSDKKIGVFATRAPYRPNALGLSCVELVNRQGLILRVKNFDLLDETPIFDVKPYLNYADAFPQASLGWLKSADEELYQIQFSPLAQEQLRYLVDHGVTELRNFILQQLQYAPLNPQKKRLELFGEDRASLCYRTWRVDFEVASKSEKFVVQVMLIRSGYSELDLNSGADPHQDKDLHRNYLKR
jgi:tRNA-Thr(GGU) m(6)t(6)A37 methyltransferase TsaA